jgi:hypothetical protein
MSKTYIVWAPGVDVERLPENSGIRIPANQRFTIDVHYNRSNATNYIDQSTVIRAKLAASVANPIDLYMFGITSGGSMNLSSTQETIVNRANGPQSSNLFIKAPFPGKLMGFFPHMHKYGTQINMKLRKTDGSVQCLTNVPRWRFSWQLNYFPKTPIPFQTGDDIELECRFKNIVPGSATVNFGENSDNEMCLGVLMYSAN